MTGRNISFPIKNADGTPFYDLVLHKATFDSVVMSLGDKITGDVYYKDNTLPVTMQEYIEYQPNDSTDVVRYVLVNPPTIVREGIASDNGDLRGMTKYSFEFYHPMYMLSNFPFTDVAVSDDEKQYLSDDKKFSWIGYLKDFVDKLNKNLQNTQWVVVINSNVSPTKLNMLSEVISFDKEFVSDALKKAYEVWGVPYIVDGLKEGEYYFTDSQMNRIDYYSPEGGSKRFVIVFGNPTNQIQSDSSEGALNTQNGVIGYNGTYYYLNSPIRVSSGQGIRVKRGLREGRPVQKPYYIIKVNVSSEDEDVTNEKLGETLSQNGEFYSDADIFVVIGGSICDYWEYVYYSREVFTFQMGKGVGLKNNSRTPKNNKIITRISGYGSEDNIPYGYPQIEWTGNQQWNYTINNQSGMQEITIGGRTFMAMSYPIYDGILGGRKVRLIKHPFTRTYLMPSIYSETVNKKVNPNAQGYDPEIDIVDYYDADSSYPNPIVPSAPSFEIHEFEKIKPRLGDKQILKAYAYAGSGHDSSAADDGGYVTPERLHTIIVAIYASEDLYYPAVESLAAFDVAATYNKTSGSDKKEGGAYNYEWSVVVRNDGVLVAKYTSDKYHIYKNVVLNSSIMDEDTQVPWDDSMNENGEYNQSYFKIKLPDNLGFDLYASAAITQEMHINMRSGDCIGCTFPVQVDWDDYKKNFYDSNGNFDPVIGEGHPRDGSKYPDSTNTSITIIVQKETETFGRLMPNIYQQPHMGDKFVILGISLPTSYITNAEHELDDAMKDFMRENNVFLYEYPLKFDEYFLAKNVDILSQMRNNTAVRFRFADNVVKDLYIKQMSIKFGDSPLPKYDITLTDDIDVVINKIGQVADSIGYAIQQLSLLRESIDLNSKLSRITDDIALGRITFQSGLNSLGKMILGSEIKSDGFVSGMDGTGRGWRIDNLGNSELESLRVRSFLEVVELLINRLQAQEGDTLFTDNDQIIHVESKTNPNDGKTYYVLTLKDKWEGYITAQQKDNIIKGIINTLAANYGNVSDITEGQSVETDGDNKYYTSWMRVVAVRGDILEWWVVDEDEGTKKKLIKNQIAVVLYPDSEVPAQKNFPPCELMTIARFGCDADPNAEGLSAGEKQSIIRRQRLFAISTTDGRITKLTGVDKPILEEKNYGTTLGVVPEFIEDWPIASRLIEGKDYLYAQGIIVGDFIKVDRSGNRLINYVDCGEWVDYNSISESDRKAGYGIYLVNEYNNESLQQETHDVWHNGSMWRCLIHQPINDGGVLVAKEPTESNHQYWKKLLAKGDNGRSYYYAGIFHSGLNFTVTNAEAPFYQYGDNYYVFVGNNGTYSTTYGDSNFSGYPNSSTNWQIMVTDFKYLISEAVFSEYAQFGSAIIKGDWMLSTNGRVNYTDYTKTDILTGVIGNSTFSLPAYTIFDPTNVQGSNIIKTYIRGETVISSSESEKNITTVSLSNEKVYGITVIGFSNNASNPISIQIYKAGETPCEPLIFETETATSLSRYFKVIDNGDHIVKIINRGYGGAITFLDIYEVSFSPNYAVNLLTGFVYQKTGVFSGFIRKQKTLITGNNISNYTSPMEEFGDYLDFDKCGSWVEFASLNEGAQFYMPSIYPDINTYTKSHLDFSRSFVGASLLIHNRDSNYSVSLTGNLKSSEEQQSGISFTIERGEFAYLECKMTSRNIGQGANEEWEEEVYWVYRKGKIK